MNEYEQQAEDFLKANNTTLKIKFHEYGSMTWDQNGEQRNIYKCTLKNETGQYTITFGDSVNNTRKKIEPNSYDILACLEKYEPEDFQYFCDCFGYEAYNENYTGHNKQSMKTYKACERQYNGLCKLFDDEQMDQLREIQ